MIELTDHHCKYPLGDVMDKAEYFCGRDAALGIRWCEGHARIVFAPPQPRRTAGHIANHSQLSAGGQNGVGGDMGSQKQETASGEALESAE